MLGSKCDKLLLNLEGTKKHLKNTSNTLVVGNPTRNAFDSITKKEARKYLGIPDGHTLIVSFGGSLGAEMMNKCIADFMTKYLHTKSSIHHIHATGKTKYAQIKEAYPELFEKHSNIRIIPYIDNMPIFLKAADIAITRSGAITISELSRCAIPSILIPSPNVASNHQVLNARYMESEGASILIEEKDLNAERLWCELSKILKSPSKSRNMASNARRICPKNTDLLIETALKDMSSAK
jgi:UDP-N-acetylglucosamine--N-acetylmuramyl-(pentapeptide) pyrophosphoryl-undecaprenol N-acetylglucosamine transferase